MNDSLCGLILQCLCTKSLSCVQLFVTPWTIDGQAPLSIRLSRQEYWNGCPALLQGISNQPKGRTHVSYVFCIGKWVLYH